MADVLWEWQNPFGWSQYDEEASTAIENAYQQKQKAVYLLEGQYGANGGYLLSLDHMTQTNMDSGNERKIRRRAVDEGETQDRKDRKDRSLLHDMEDDWDDSNNSTSQSASQGYSRHTLRSQTQKLSQSSNSGNLTRLTLPSLRSSGSDLSQSNAPMHFLRSASNSVGSQSISRSNSANLSQHFVSGYHSRNSSNNLSQASTTQASSTNAPTMTTKRLRSEKSEKSSHGLELEASMPIPIPKKKATGASFPVPSPIYSQSFPTPGYAPPFSFKTIPASSSFPLAHDDSFLSFHGSLPIKKDKHSHSLHSHHHASHSLHSSHSTSNRILVRSHPTAAIELDLAYKLLTDRDAVNDDAPLVEIRLK